MVLKGRGQPAGKVSSPPTRLLHVCGDQGSRFWVHQVFFNGETVVFKRGTEEQNCAGLELTLSGTISGSEIFKVVSIFCKELWGDEALLTVRRYEMT